MEDPAEIYRTSPIGPAALAATSGTMMPMSHEKHDKLSLALAQHIAEGLKQHPEWILLAKDNLNRWSQQNAGVPSLLACYLEWRDILELSVEDISAALLDPTDRGQRLRQNSPFAGALPAAEVWRMKQQAYETTPV